MADFFGRYDYIVDPKGRVNIPAKFRKTLTPEAEETFIIFQATENCLRVYPKDVWAKFKTKLFSLPNTPKNRWVKRMITDTGSDSALDVQGRITLTAAQLKLAKITKEVTILGMLDHIEIWNTENYEKYKETPSEGVDFDKAFYDIETELAEL